MFGCLPQAAVVGRELTWEGLGFPIMGDPGVFGGLRSPCLGYLAALILWGKIFQYLFRDIVFTWMDLDHYGLIPFFMESSSWV